jgi:hypothetical protein
VGGGFRKCHGKMGKWNVEVLVVLVRVKGKGFKACSGVLHGSDVVATDGRSGHRGVCAGRHRGGASAVGRPSGDAWARAGAGGGARGVAPAASGGGRSEAEEKQRCQRRKKADRSQKDSFVISKNSRDSSVN